MRGCFKPICSKLLIFLLFISFPVTTTTTMTTAMFHDSSKTRCAVVSLWFQIHFGRSKIGIGAVWMSPSNTNKTTTKFMCSRSIEFVNFNSVRCHVRLINSKLFSLICLQNIRFRWRSEVLALSVYWEVLFYCEWILRFFHEKKKSTAPRWWVCEIQ